MRVADACTKSTSWDSKVGASGKVMSWGRRLPNGSQISEGLNRNRSEADTTVTSTSPSSSCLTLSAAVRPPKLPPSTRTFLRMTITWPFAYYRLRYGEAGAPHEARTSRVAGTNDPTERIDDDCRLITFDTSARSL